MEHSWTSEADRGIKFQPSSSRFQALPLSVSNGVDSKEVMYKINWKILRLFRLKFLHPSTSLFFLFFNPFLNR